MYHTHFGLKEVPFSIKVNPSFLFMTQQHKDALATLLYGASAEGGFALLTGEIGTGKTTLVRALLQQIPDDIDVALVLNPTLNPAELLATICDELKVSYSTEEQNLKSLTDKLQGYLLERHAQGRGVVVLIDEAQHLQVDALEQIRLLTNLETDTRKLLQIILVGQPELDEKLRGAELKQLAQRITARFHLGTLSLEETQAYIRHRLQVAGLPPQQELFSPLLIERIHRETEGVPRLVNILCDRILLGAYARKRSDLDNELVDLACEEVFGQLQKKHSQESKPRHALWNTIAAVGLVAVLLLAYSRYFNNPQSSSENSAAIDAISELKSTELSIRSKKQANLDLSLNKAEPQLAGQGQLPVQTQGENVSSDAWWKTGYKNEADALNALLVHQGLIDQPASEPCIDIQTLGFACHQQSSEVWPELTSMNRIAIIKILTPARFHTYVAMIGLKGEIATILLPTPDPISNTISELALSKMGELWTGGSTLIWSVPNGFQKPVGLGSSGPVVKWVAENFASLDQREEPLTASRFSRALSERVKLFQRAHRLKDDGIVGMQTVMKLDDAVGAGSPLQLNSSPFNNPQPGGTHLSTDTKEEVR